MKLYNKKFKRLMIVPLILFILFIFLIFVRPGIQEGIDLKGGNSVIVHYTGYKDFSNIETKLKDNFNLKDIHISSTKSPTMNGLIIEFSSQPEIEKARNNKDKINYSNINLIDLKQKAKDILNPLINLGYLDKDVTKNIDNFKTKSEIKDFLATSISIANNNFNEKVILMVKNELNLEKDAKIQFREVAATLGNDFIKNSIKIGVVALFLLIIVILAFFRQLTPSILVIFAAIFDVFSALAGMAILNVSLSLTTIPALLMLIGYSVDTDIMLSTRVLKDPSKKPFAAANNSIKTGMTMTLTTMSSILVMLIVSYYTQMIVVLEISVILLFGLLGDLISTWFFNAPALINYILNKEKVK